MRLPLADARVSTVRRQESDVPEPDLPLRIVLIEDEDDVRSTMRSLLQQWGHEVSAAASGAEGVALVLKTRPEVAVLDVGLPDMDGYGVARQIREGLGDACPRLIAVTGYGQPPDRKRAEEAGFDAHLLKPANPKELRRALRRG